MPAVEIDVAYLRRLGNLPGATQLGDSVLAPHVESAISEVSAILGARVPQNEAEEGRVRLAMGCFAMANALPVLNTFYLSRAEMTPRQVAMTDYVFHDAGELLKLAAYWKNRGYEALREVGRTGGTVGVTVI